MLRRAIRCLAPAGPAWTTFKSLVDQGAIPNVDAGKAEAVFATLSSDQLKQLADAAAKLKHKSRCAEQDAAKKDAAHADHIQKLPTRAAARAELERRLAELAAREKSLRDRLLTLDDTPTLVLDRDAAKERLAEVTATLDSTAGLMSWGELRDSEAERRDAEALIDRRDAEIARATALREHLADVVAASEGLRTVLTTRVAHLDEKLEAANSTAASDRDALNQRVAQLQSELEAANQSAASICDASAREPERASPS
jgi:chromosome segregation ATPase